MIVDLTTIEAGEVLEADLIIIGGGLAGITLANSLLKDGLSVILLEAGGLDVDLDNQAQYEGNATLSDGKHESLELDGFLTDSRVRAYGGSGHWWGGKCAPLSAEDFESREWVPESGWPISRTDLNPYYDMACDSLNIDRFNHTKPDLTPSQGNYIGINDNENLTSRPRRFTRITGQNRHQEDFDRFRFKTRDSNTTSVYLNANVVGFDMRRDKTALSGVRIETLAGKTFIARGKQFVLACGGLENIRLLLAAAQSGDITLDKTVKSLGRYFQGHLAFDLYADKRSSGTKLLLAETSDDISAYTNNSSEGEKVVIAVTRQGQKASGSGAMTLTLSRDSTIDRHGGLAIEATYQTLLSSSSMQSKVQNLACYFMPENRPLAESRVTLSDVTDRFGMPRIELNWVFGTQDKLAFQKAIALAASEFGSSGKGRVCADIPNVEYFDSVNISRHHMGGTRMSRSAETGVVDPNLRHHDIENLFVLGSTVFPTSGIANPTLTILALAFRLSQHLSETVFDDR